MTTAILLVNLGTPDEPTAPAVKRYLAEFLGDPRVVELPRLLWLPILHGIILNTRPARSAAKYATIWTPEGSPLKVHTERQAKLLKGLLGERGHKDLLIDWAMRYGNPSIPSVLDRLAAAGATEVLILPLYPQFAGSTTASTHDAVNAWLKRRKQLPAPPTIGWVNDYPTDPGYIGALAASIRDHWAAHGRGDKLLMSFHGIPQRSVDRGDPYAKQCHATAQALAAALGLSENEWLATFQSRFGAAKWLQPYTQPTLEELARDGLKRVDVICPGFPADCLETLEEIAMECREAFLHAGGESFHYLPCLNERADWIAALADICLARLGG
jgi:protoporphyrin/coproporphyrin ferrochelatase